MSDLLYYICCGLLIIGILIGIALMAKVRTAAAGNLLSCLCSVLAIALTLVRYHILSDGILYLWMAAGLVVGLILTFRVKMIEMPQTVALLNGLGGAASGLVAILVLASPGFGLFTVITGVLALAVGSLTFSGSLVAAGKLHRLLPQRPVIFAGQKALLNLSLLLMLLPVVTLALGLAIWVSIIVGLLASLGFGLLFSLRVGGADMPITISLLNSLSGVAGAIAGMSVNDPLLTAAGGIVGASGLLLTQIMCRAMNRSLSDILLGKTSVAASAAVANASVAVPRDTLAKPAATGTAKPAVEQPAAADILRQAKDVIIIPGYGMALAQAQEQVRALAKKLEANGAQVRFAIHPVAGRMPGHMNVLLCEVDIPYDQLYELDAINNDFTACDAVVIVGANDVVNPAAREAEGTPIYGMPILRADQAPWAIVCNFDRQPGYAGVPNTLYDAPRTILLLGDAKDTVQSLTDGV